MSIFLPQNRKNFFQKQTENIWLQWETFKEDLQEEEGEFVLTEWDIYDVWDEWMERVEIDRTEADCFNPSLLPGMEDNFAAFKDYCKLKDPAFFADAHNEIYLDWLVKNPEEFFTMLYVFVDKPREIAHHPRNGEWSMQDVVRAVNTRDARTYIHVLQACKIDLYEQSGTPITYRKEFKAIVPYDYFAARTTRLINSYGGFEWKEDAQKRQGPYADMYIHLPVLNSTMAPPLTVKVPSRAVSGDVVECLECGAWTNETLQTHITKEHASKLVVKDQSRKTKKQIINHEVSIKAAENLRKIRKEKEQARAERSRKRKENYAKLLDSVEKKKEAREKRGLIALAYFGIHMIEEYDDAAILQIIKLKLLESPGVKKVKDELSTILRKWDYLADWVVVELKQALNNYEETFQN